MDWNKLSFSLAMTLIGILSGIVAITLGGSLLALLGVVIYETMPWSLVAIGIWLALSAVVYFNIDKLDKKASEDK